MSIDWKIVRKEHIVRACELVSSSKIARREKVKGLVVKCGDAELPAKQVLRVAYCVAKGWPLDTHVKFASGDSTLNLLRKLGFEAQRRSLNQAQVG